MGGDDSKPQKQSRDPEQIKRQEKRNTKIKAQAIQNDLDGQIKAFEDKQAKYEAKIEKLKEKAKECLQNDKKKEAKKYAEEATKVKKQLQGIQNRRKILFNKKFEIQTHQMDKDVIDNIEIAQKQIMKQDTTGRLEQIMIQERENKIIQNERDAMFNEMAQREDSEEEETDEMMKELMGEVEKDKKKNIAQKNVNVNIDKNVNYQKNKEANNKNDIEAMLNNL